MTGHQRTLWPHDAPAVLVHALIYVALGALSLPTAYVQANTAAVWLPSGYAVGLLLAKGLQYWPSVALGSFLFNLSVNLFAPGGGAAILLFSTAGLVAAGNTVEALLGAYLTTRYANGAGFLWRPRSVARFILLVPIAPLISTFVGVAASRAGGVPIFGSVSDVALTWYIANVEGLLLFTGLTLLVLGGRIEGLSLRRSLELAALAIALAVGISIMCGVVLSDWMEGWPRAYMLIPLVIWATFRFRIHGGLIAVALITLGASIATIKGYVVFPAETPWRALIYLQAYLAMLAMMTLAMGASLEEAEASRSELEYRVEKRTRSIEQLLEQRDVLSALVAHDLKSPIYSIRNTLRAGRAGILNGSVSQADLADALDVMEQACTALADRVGSLLPTPLQLEAKKTRKRLDKIVSNSTAAHRSALRARNVSLILETHDVVLLENGTEAEHILDTLIDNAIRHTPEGGAIRISAKPLGDRVAINVSDEGVGVSPDDIEHLFERKSALDGREPGVTRTGLGLHLAKRLADWAGGSLAYHPALQRGATFTLTVAGSFGEEECAAQADGQPLPEET